MKILILLTVFAIPVLALAQAPKYMTFKYIPPSAPGMCDGKVFVNLDRMTPPVQFYYHHFDYAENNYTRIGNEVNISELCSGDVLTLEVLDSACSYIQCEFYLSPDTAYQLMLDTLYAVLPSTAVAADGSLTYKLKNTLTPTFNYFTKFSGPGTYSYTTLDTSFSGLDIGEYSFKVVDSTFSGNYLRIDAILKYVTPLPCNHDFTTDVSVYPVSPGNCDGVITMRPTIGDTSDFSGTMIGYATPGYPILNDPGGGFNFFDIAYNICPQPVLINHFRHSVSNEYRFFNKVFFLGVDSSLTDIWSPPSTAVPSGLDTILISASYICGLDYFTSPDTVYVDSIISLGAGYYDFVIIIAQDTSQLVVHGIVEADTSGSFFIDFTYYCPDTIVARAGGPEFKYKRNLIFYGDQVLSVNEKEEMASLNKVLIYPNPTSDFLRINSSMINLKRVEIVDLNGSILFAIDSNNKIIDLNLQDLSSSVYLIKYIDEFGNFGFQRFIKM